VETYVWEIAHFLQRIGKQPHYLVQGRYTHSKTIYDPAIKSAFKVGDNDFKNTGEPQYLGLLKEPQPLSEEEFQKTFKEITDLTKYSNFKKFSPENNRENARIIHEALQNKDL
jgi:hypothetical protein